MKPIEGKAELEFPLDYAFKVIVDPNKVEEEQLIQIVISLLNDSNRFKSSTNKPSKKGTYISYTLTAHLTSRDELETLYRAFKKMEGVVYLL